MTTRHLLVIGAQRCGTTRLYHLLDAHPEIAMARPARPEPKVFLSDELASRGLDWYRATYFADAPSARLLGEKSTSYLEDAAAPVRAASVLGTAEIVVQLRDPVARAVSNWRFSVAHGVEDRPLVQALEENLLGPREWDPAQTSVSPFAYLERGCYLTDLAPWLDCFPDTVHVRFLEDGRGGSSPIGPLYQALGVDADFRPPNEQLRVNASAGSLPDLPEALVRRLRNYFRPCDEMLSRRLDLALPWSGR